MDQSQKKTEKPYEDLYSKVIAQASSVSQNEEPSQDHMQYPQDKPTPGIVDKKSGEKMTNLLTIFGIFIAGLSLLVLAPLYFRQWASTVIKEEIAAMLLGLSKSHQL